MATRLSQIKKGAVEEFMEEWTSTGTMTIPDGCRVIHVTAVGAGGTGSSSVGGDGGQSGMMVFDKPYIVQESDTINITVGSGDTVVTLGASVIVRAAAGASGQKLQRVIDPWAVQLSGGLGSLATSPGPAEAGESSSSGTGGAAGSGGTQQGGGGAAGLEGNGGVGGGTGAATVGTGYGSGGGGQGSGGGGGAAGTNGLVRIRYYAYEKAVTT